MNSYLDYSNASGFAVGDRVRITRIASSYEGGWAAPWGQAMDAMVEDTVYTIDRADSGQGFRMQGSRYTFPFFVLEHAD